MSSVKATDSAPPHATPAAGVNPAAPVLECNIKDCNKKYKTIAWLINHQKKCHGVEISEEAIKKFGVEAKNINLDDTEDLNMSESLLKQLPQSSQKEGAEEGGKEKEGEKEKEDSGKLKRGRTSSLLDDDDNEDEESKRLRIEIQELPLDSRLLDDTEVEPSSITVDEADNNDEIITSTQAARDMLLSDILASQKPPEVQIPAVSQEIPSSASSDGLSILNVPEPIERSRSDMFDSGSTGGLDPNKEIIKEQEEELKRRTDSLTAALAENESLKTSLALSQAKVDTQNHLLDNKSKELDKWIKAAQSLKSKLNETNSSKQSLTPTQLAPGIADELIKVKAEKEHLKKLYEIAIKEKAGAIKEKDDAVLVAQTNQDLSRRIEDQLKIVRGQLAYYMKQIQCVDENCSDAKICGKSHEEKEKRRGGAEDTREQCNFYNKGVCKFDSKICKRKHCPRLKMEFLEQNPGYPHQKPFQLPPSQHQQQGDSSSEMEVDISTPPVGTHPYQHHQQTANNRPYVSKPNLQQAQTPAQVQPQQQQTHSHQVNIPCSNMFNPLAQANCSLNSGGGCNNSNSTVAPPNSEKSDNNRAKSKLTRKEKRKRSLANKNGQSQNPSSNSSEGNQQQQQQGGQTGNTTCNHNTNPNPYSQPPPNYQPRPKPEQSPAPVPTNAHCTNPPPPPPSFPPGFQQTPNQGFRLPGPAPHTGVGAAGPQSNWLVPPPPATKPTPLPHPSYPPQIIPNVDPFHLAAQAQQAQTLRNIQHQQYLRMELEKVQNSLTLSQVQPPGTVDYAEIQRQQEQLRLMMNR